VVKSRLKFSTAAVAVVLLLLGMTAAAQTTSIQFDGTTFRVNGWRAPAQPPTNGWASIFRVYAGTGDVPPLAGSYSVENGVLVFHPTYPVAPGVHYRAIFQPPTGGATVTAAFDGPHLDRTPTTQIVHVYPSTSVLPSNELRLYIYFSAPMSRGEAARYLHVLDENGKELAVGDAVLLPGEELWDPKFERLTMTFDPGRIKRGLTSNEKLGPPITEGKHYTLVIDRNWPDAKGAPLVAGFRKLFVGGPPERNPPDPKKWRVTKPVAGTAEPLVIDFPTPMNYPLLQRMITVTDKSGNIAGDISITRMEMEWQFTPRDKWKPGDYNIVIDTDIEDLAGNHVGQPFDIDEFKTVTKSIPTQTVSLPFTVH
jgi:hypothetical protein